MTTYGKIKSFNPATDNWLIYQEKLQFYFDANRIEEASKKHSILLTVCGDPTFKLLHSLVPDGKLNADAVTYMYSLTCSRLITVPNDPPSSIVSISTPAPGSQRRQLLTMLQHYETLLLTASTAVQSYLRRCYGIESSVG
jgi:hypothetical protein